MSHGICLVVIKAFHQNAVHTEITDMELTWGTIWEIVCLWVNFVLLFFSDSFQQLMQCKRSDKEDHLTSEIFYEEVPTVLRWTAFSGEGWSIVVGAGA